MDAYLKFMELCIAILEVNKMVVIEGMSNEPDGQALMDAHVEVEDRIQEFLKTHPDGKELLATLIATNNTKIQIAIQLDAQIFPVE